MPQYALSKSGSVGATSATINTGLAFAHQNHLIFSINLRWK